WGTKGGLALLDQGLFAGAHFLLNVLLARWLPPAEYGAFALAYSVFLLVASLHGAMLLEPMMIFGSGRYKTARKNYLWIVLRGHWALTLPASLLLIALAFVVGRLYTPSVTYALLALGVVLPLLLLMWFTRRAFYIELLPGWSTAGSAVYFLLLLAATAWLFQAGRLTPVTAILAMGAASLLVAAMQVVRLRPASHSLPGGVTSKSAARDHWQYGRWALASAAAMWFPINIYYLALPAWAGMEGAGALKALMNLANPVLHSLIALGMLIVPLLVRHRDRGGIRLMQQTISRLAGLFLLGSAAYLAALWYFRVEILQLLYGGKYMEYSGAPVLLVGLLPIAASLTLTLGSALRALERPDRLFWCYLASSGVALLLGLPLLAYFGLTGALAGLLGSYVATAAAMYFFVRRSDSGATQIPDAVAPASEVT
ncbi:MAG TPA: polysaccharide biosynthesis C-terminal domain-containing protein, partial [Anaerolineales bacterium]